jgi:hypothetical protein
LLSGGREVSAVTDLQHTNVPDAAPVEQHRSTVNRWLAGGLVVALLAAIALGAWVYNDHHETAATPSALSGLASPEGTAMLAARVAAVNGGSAATIAGFYSPDAVLEELDQEPPVVTKTNANIGEWLFVYQSSGFRLQRTGTATALGPFVAEPLLWSGGGGGMVTYELDSDGKIVHQWVTGGIIPGINGP